MTAELKQLKQLEQLATLLKSHNLTRLEYEHGDVRVVMEQQLAGSQQSAVLPQAAETLCADQGQAEAKQAEAMEAASEETARAQAGGLLLSDASPKEKNPTPTPAAATDGAITVTAPLVGITYRSREPGEAPFIESGRRVAEGDVLCLIEAMKLFNEITAPCAGIVSAILFEDGALAEYGAPLVIIDPFLLDNTSTHGTAS